MVMKEFRLQVLGSRALVRKRFHDPFINLLSLVWPKDSASSMVEVKSFPVAAGPSVMTLVVEREFQTGVEVMVIVVLVVMVNIGLGKRN